jgi:Protein of unknown function (DUF3618)
MGASTAETVREIEATRARLDADLSELQGRLPAPAVWAKRMVAVLVGSGVAGSAFWFGVHRLRRRRREKVRTQAVQAVVQVVPEQWAAAVSGAMEDGRWKQLAGAFLGAWALFRLAELRQLRRTNQMMMARSLGA